MRTAATGGHSSRPRSRRGVRRAGSPRPLTAPRTNRDDALEDADAQGSWQLPFHSNDHPPSDRPGRTRHRPRLGRLGCTPKCLGDRLTGGDGSTWGDSVCGRSAWRGDGGMDRAGAGASRGPLCPSCAAEIEAPDDHEPEGGDGRCPRCGGRVPAVGLGPGARSGREAAAPPQRSAPLGGLRLAWRNWILRLIERLYWSGTLGGTLTMLACGGIVPVIRAWLRNEVDDWPGVVAALGGLWFRVDSLDPDSDLGPVLAR